MGANAVISDSIKHRRYRAYMQRRLICIVSLTLAIAGLAALICVDLGLFPRLTEIIDINISKLNEQNKYTQVPLIEKYVRTFAVYCVIAGALLAFRTLLEKMKESFFTAIIGAVATFLVSIQLFQSTFLFFENAFPMYWQRYLLILSYVAFGIFWFYYWGYYPLSTKILIDAMSRSLGYNERISIDWVKEGITDYTLEAFPLEKVIPQDVAHLSIQMNGVKRENLNQVLDRFFNSKPQAEKSQEALILIGGFGSGKSTALAKCVQRQLYSKKHYGEIPIYVKLRDWLENDILDKKQQYNNYKNTRDDMDFYLSKLSSIIVGNLDADNQGNIKNILINLHENRRLLYAFDGLNELLQRSIDDSDSSREQKAKDLCTFLYRFCAGNRCIISMCEIPGVLTSRSILFNQVCYYQIYAVDGVVINSKKIADWSLNYRHSVALYRLAQNELMNGNMVPLTMYKLLENYVKRQINSELIDTDEAKECLSKLKLLFQARIKSANGSDSYYIHPYSHLYPIDNTKLDANKDEKYLSALINCRILYRSEINNKEQDLVPRYQYHFCHILVYEYLLAEYLIHNLSENEIGNVFIGNDNNKPNILEHTHLQSVLTMLLSTLLDNEKGIHIIISVLSKVNPDYKMNTFVLLSKIIEDATKIQDNRMVLNKALVELNDQIKIYLESGHITLSKKIALLKIYQNSSDKKTKISNELLSQNNKSWVFLNSKQDLLLEGTRSALIDLENTEG